MFVWTYGFSTVCEDLSWRRLQQKLVIPFAPRRKTFAPTKTDTHHWFDMFYCWIHPWVCMWRCASGAYMLLVSWFIFSLMLVKYTNTSPQNGSAVSNRVLARILVFLSTSIKALIHSCCILFTKWDHKLGCWGQRCSPYSTHLIASLKFPCVSNCSGSNWSFLVLLFSYAQAWRREFLSFNSISLLNQIMCISQIGVIWSLLEWRPFNRLLTLISTSLLNVC